MNRCKILLSIVTAVLILSSVYSIAKEEAPAVTKEDPASSPANDSADDYVDDKLMSRIFEREKIAASEVRDTTGPTDEFVAERGKEGAREERIQSEALQKDAEIDNRGGHYYY